MSTIKPALKKRITNLYPDNIVSDIKTMDEELFNDLNKVAKEEKVTIKEILENNGFSYSRKSMPQIYIEDYKEINNLYENKVIESLHENHTKLYYKLLNHAKLKNQTLKQYLNSLGFDYELKKENVLVSDLKKELNKMYKDKVVVSLSKNSPALYYKLYQTATKENKTIPILLKEMGYTVPEKTTRKRRTKAEIMRDNNRNDKNDSTKNKTVKESNTKNKEVKTEETKTTPKSKTTTKTNSTNKTSKKTDEKKKTSNTANTTNSKTVTKTNSSTKKVTPKEEAVKSKEKSQTKATTPKKNTAKTTETKSNETKKTTTSKKTATAEKKVTAEKKTNDKNNEDITNASNKEIMENKTESSVNNEENNA